MRRIVKEENGYSMVEFALVLPVMLLMIGLIFDMGRAVHTKTELQNLAGEIQKTVTLYEEAGVEGGLQYYSGYPTLEGLVKMIVDGNTNLDKEKLKYSVDISGVDERYFEGHYFNAMTGRFDRYPNRLDVKYVTVNVEYELEYGMFITKTILGEGMKFSDSFTGLMYAGGDGWDEETR